MTHQQTLPAEHLAAKLPQRVTGLTFSNAGDLLVAADSGGNLLQSDPASPSAKGRRCRISTPKMNKKSVSIVLAEKSQRIFIASSGVRPETPSQAYGISDIVGECTVLHALPLRDGRPHASRLVSLGTLFSRCSIVAMDDGRRVAVGGYEITIHDATDPNRSQSYPSPGFTTALAAGAKETLYVGDTHGGITAWTPKSSKPIVHHGAVEGPIYAMALSADGRRLAFAAGNSVCVAYLGTPRLQILRDGGWSIDSIYFGRQDQEVLCSSSKTGYIERWRIDSGLGEFLGIRGISTFAVSREWQRLVVGSNKGYIRVFDLDEEFPTFPVPRQTDR